MSNYKMTMYRIKGGLLALWIWGPDAPPAPGSAWEKVGEITLPDGVEISAALRDRLLMSEAVSDALFRDTVDTWLGPVEDDPLDDYPRLVP